MPRAITGFLNACLIGQVIPVTHLRPTFFAQWLLDRGTLASIADSGGLRLRFAKGRHAPIAAEDQARLIAAILTNPLPYRGKTYPLRGPVEMNYFEIASTIGSTGTTAKIRKIRPCVQKTERLSAVFGSAATGNPAWRMKRQHLRDPRTKRTESYA